MITPLDQIAYIGCPSCYKKVTDSRLTGFFCNTCKEVIKEKYLYFIHAIFQDFTDRLVIGFSREQAQSLMNDVDAHTFMTQTRRKFKSEADYETWLQENVFYKPLRIFIKAKSEQFKGENRQRFYAIDVSPVSIACQDQESDDQPKTKFSSENKVLLEKLSQPTNSSQ